MQKALGNSLSETQAHGLGVRHRPDQGSVPHALHTGGNSGDAAVVAGGRRRDQRRR